MAAGAPAALFLAVFAPPLWPLGLVWAVIIGLLIAADAVLGADRRRLKASLDVDLPARIGSPVEARIDLAFGAGAPSIVRVQAEANELLRARRPSERAAVADGAAHCVLTFDTVRRGMGRIDRIWVEWRCPLGLLDKRRMFRVDQSLPIQIDVHAVTNEAMRIYGRSTTMGEKVVIEKGGGSEFESLREFVAGMDLRTIDWKQSARHNRLLGKEYRSERDQTIILAVDTGRLMSEPLGEAPKIDHAVQAALLLGYVSLRSGDRVAIFGFDARPRVFSGVLSGVGAFQQLQNFAARLDYSAEETNFTLGLARLSMEVRRRALVIVFTDFVDATGAELMIENLGRLMRRHRVVFVSLKDPDLERVVQAEPNTTLDISRAVVAFGMAQQREEVLKRIARSGAEIIDAPANRLRADLLNRYLDLKQRSQM